MVDYSKEVVTSISEFPVEILKTGLTGNYTTIGIYKDSYNTTVTLRLNETGESLEGPSVKNKPIIIKSFFNFYVDSIRVNYLVQHNNLDDAREYAGYGCVGQIEISYDLENKKMEVKKI